MLSTLTPAKGNFGEKAKKAKNHKKHFFNTRTMQKPCESRMAYVFWCLMGDVTMD